MINPELIRGIVTMHHYPASTEHLTRLAAMYPSIRADADALGECMGDSDFPPSVRFSANPVQSPRT